MKTWKIILLLIPLLGAGIKQESMNIEKIRISQLPVAPANEITEDMEIIINTAEGKTKRATFGSIKANATCERFCSGVAVSSLEIQNINTVPIVLIPAQGAGKIVNVHSVVILMQNSTIGYATDDTPFVRQRNNVPVTKELFTGTNCWNKANDGIFKLIPVDPEDKGNITVDDDIILTTQSNDPTGGDGDALVFFEYSIITL